MTPTDPSVSELRSLIVACQDDVLGLRSKAWMGVTDPLALRKTYRELFRRLGKIGTALGLQPRGPSVPGCVIAELDRPVATDSAWAHVSWFYVFLDTVKVHSALSFVCMARADAQGMADQLDWVHNFPEFMLNPYRFEPNHYVDIECRVERCLMHRAIDDHIVEVPPGRLRRSAPVSARTKPPRYQGILERWWARWRGSS